MFTTQPFRFLDLPAELRLMVYERLPVSPITVVYKEPSNDETYLHLTSIKFQTAMLATCKQIKDEVTPFLKTAILANEPKITYTTDSPDRLLVETSLGDIQSSMYGRMPDRQRHSQSPLTYLPGLGIWWVSSYRQQALATIIASFKAITKDIHELQALCEFCFDAVEHLRVTGGRMRLDVYCPNWADWRVRAFCTAYEGRYTSYPPMITRVLDERPEALPPKSGSDGDVIIGEDDPWAIWKLTS